MIMYLFVTIIISLIFSVLTIYDESPLAEALDFIMKILTVIVTLIYLINVS